MSSPAHANGVASKGPVTGEAAEFESLLDGGGHGSNGSTGPIENGGFSSMESSDDAIDLADEVSVLDLDTSADVDDDGNIPKPRKTRKNREGEEEDYYFQHEWPHHKKHVFILSNSGKPVYSRSVLLHSFFELPRQSKFASDLTSATCRHGDEQKLCAFMPVLSAISSFVDATGDTIK